MQDLLAPRYDLMILGASGFTGKYFVKEALKFLNTPSSPLKSLALAGRNPTKLSQTLQWASHPNPPPPIPILTDPAEFGLMFNSRQWVGLAVPNRVEAYVSLGSEKRIVGNFGTFESAVLGVANAAKLMELRRSRPKKPRPAIPGPPPSKGPTIEHQKKIGLWAV